MSAGVSRCLNSAVRWQLCAGEQRLCTGEQQLEAPLHAPVIIHLRNITEHHGTQNIQNITHYRTSRKTGLERAELQY